MLLEGARVGAKAIMRLYKSKKKNVVAQRDKS